MEVSIWRSALPEYSPVDWKQREKEKERGGGIRMDLAMEMMIQWTH